MGRWSGWTTAQIQEQMGSCEERGEDLSIQHLPAGRGHSVPPWAHYATRGLADERLVGLLKAVKGWGGGLWMQNASPK